MLLVIQQNTMDLLHKSISDVVSHIHDYASSPTDFTRNRKLPAAELIRFLLNMEGNSLNAEIFNNFPEINSRMTASAFVQQRAKLKPEAFKELLYQFNSSMKSPKTLNGLRLYAIDGSDFCLPLNRESKWYYPQSLCP